MHFNKYLFPFLSIILVFTVRGQTNTNTDTLLALKPTVSSLTPHKKPLNAIGLITATNLGVWSYDRFVTKAPFAQINLNTIKQNFNTGFVWDSDKFSMNFLAHPYHGGLYFNAARSNELNFWQSIPFAAAGSLEWELFMEIEPPSINDFASTTIGGSCIGEICYRISDLFIDERTVGFERIKREALLTIISPVRGINRLLNGDTWKKRNIKGNSLPTPSVSFYSTLGCRHTIDYTAQNNVSNPLVCYDLGLCYGNPFDIENEKPYDFFSIELSGNLGSKQPIINRANMLGILLSKNIPLQKARSQLTFGIFQHFNYYLVNADQKNLSLNPYKISEAASAGPGVLFKNQLTKKTYFVSSAHLGAILMGGCQTDHYEFNERDYNMGSGFSAKLNVEFRFSTSARLLLSYEDYNIYSWTGNNPANGKINPNVQGDVSNTRLQVERLQFSYIIKKHILLSAETDYYYRKSIYRYYLPTNQHITNHKLSVGYFF